MSKVDVIRAWKDVQYRETLTGEQLSSLPGNPAGLLELDDLSLSSVVGNKPEGTQRNGTNWCCDGLTNKTCFSKGCNCNPIPATAAVDCTFSASVDPLKNQ